MFKTVKRIIDWCGKFKGKLYLGFVMIFFSHIFAALPLALAAYTVGLLIESQSGGAAFDAAWIWKTIVIQIVLVLLSFLFDYLRARLQEPISYQLTARDRLAVGDALKRVSLGYFQTMSTGNILNSITTGLSTLENMGIRMIDNFIGGYLNFLVIFVCLAVCSPVTALIALAAAALSLGFMLIISRYSSVNAPVEAQANRDMTGAVIEYARGLAVVKSFGKSGAAMESVTKAIGDSKRIHLKIEWGYVPANALHLLALKCGSVGLAFAAAMQCLNGQMDFSVMLMFVFFSFSIFASLEPISDSAHTLGVIDDAMDQLDALRGEHFIDADGHDVKLGRYDIRFNHVDFGYGMRGAPLIISHSRAGALFAVIIPAFSTNVKHLVRFAAFFALRVGGGRCDKDAQCFFCLEAMCREMSTEVDVALRKSSSACGKNIKSDVVSSGGDARR